MPSTTIEPWCQNLPSWIYQNVAEYGGDPHQIHISGHSAGGHMVAMMMTTAWPSLGQSLPMNLVKGGCAISGLFDLIPVQRSYVNENIRMDEATAQQNSPVLMRPSTPNPLIIAVGEAESAEYHAQSQALAEAWSIQPNMMSVQVIPDANHFSVLEALAQTDGLLFQAILRQMNV